MKLVKTWDEGGKTYFEFTDGVFRSIKTGPRAFAYPTGNKREYWAHQIIKQAQRDLEWCRGNVDHVSLAPGQKQE